MSQTMIRVDKKTNFVVLNKDALQDVNLSWKAKGLLVYLLSLPDNWQIYIEELSAHAKDGVDSTASAIKELMKNGYITRERIRNEKGQLKNYIYTVHEVPESVEDNDVEPKRENPVLEQPKQENPRQEKPILEKRQLLNNNKLNNNLNIKEEKTTQGVEIDKEIIKVYRECISKNISDMELKELSELQDIFGIEILNKAIEVAVMKNAKNLAYIQASLKDWSEKGFKTLDEVEVYLAKWKVLNKKSKENREKEVKRKAENKDYGNRVSTFNNFEQRTYDFDKLENQLLGWEQYEDS